MTSQPNLQAQAAQDKDKPDCTIFLCGLPSTVRQIDWLCTWVNWEAKSPDPRLQESFVKIPPDDNDSTGRWRRAKVVRYRHHNHEKDHDPKTPDYVKHALAPWEYPCGFLFVYDPGTYPAAALDVLRQCVDLYKSWQCCRGFWILIHENPRQSHSWKGEEFRKTLAQIRELDEILAPSGGLDEPTLRTESYKEACLQVGLALLDDARPFVPESVASAKFSDDDWRRGNWPSTWSHVNYLRAAWETLMNCKYRLGIDLPEIAAEFEARLLRSRKQYCSFPITRQHRTLAVFWLHQLAIGRMRSSLSKEIHSHGHENVHGVCRVNGCPVDPWMPLSYFSRDLLESEQASMFWMLPDLRVLQPETPGGMLFSAKREGKQHEDEDFERLFRLAFYIVHRYRRIYPAETRPRSWFIKKAFAAMQRQTTRLRASHPDIPPFSETQAYFYVQLVHACLYRFSQEHFQRTHFRFDDVPYAHFRKTSNVSPAAWKEYYTPEVWNSVSARAQFIPPDIKPLPDRMEDWALPDMTDLYQRSLYSHIIERQRDGEIPEVPPAEAQLFYQAIILEEAKAVPSPVPTDPNQITNYAHLLRFIHTYLVKPAAEWDDEKRIRTHFHEHLEKLKTARYVRMFPFKEPATVAATVALHARLRELRDKRRLKEWHIGGPKRSYEPPKKKLDEWEEFEQWIKSDWGTVLAYDKWWAGYNAHDWEVMLKPFGDIWSESKDDAVDETAPACEQKQDQQQGDGDEKEGELEEDKAAVAGKAEEKEAGLENNKANAAEIAEKPLPEKGYAIVGAQTPSKDDGAESKKVASEEEAGDGWEIVA